MPWRGETGGGRLSTLTLAVPAASQVTWTQGESSRNSKMGQRNQCAGSGGQDSNGNHSSPQELMINISKVQRERYPWILTSAPADLMSQRGFLSEKVTAAIDPKTKKMPSDRGIDHCGR